MHDILPRLNRNALRFSSMRLTHQIPAAAWILAAIVCAAAPKMAGNPSSSAAAGAAAGQAGSTEMEQTLYVQAPEFANAGDSIVLIWLPEPLVNTCMGRTAKECFTIDYCIRTTNPDGPQCKNLPIPRARLPHYPPGMQPKRGIAVVLRALGNSNGFDRLKDFYRSAPKGSLERLSPDATIRARIRYTSTPSFEGFTLIEVLSTP